MLQEEETMLQVETLQEEEETLQEEEATLQPLRPLQRWRKETCVEIFYFLLTSLFTGDPPTFTSSVSPLWKGESQCSSISSVSSDSSCSISISAVFRLASGDGSAPTAASTSSSHLGLSGGLCGVSPSPSPSDDPLASASGVRLDFSSSVSGCCTTSTTSTTSIFSSISSSFSFSSFSFSSTSSTCRLTPPEAGPHLALGGSVRVAAAERISPALASRPPGDGGSADVSPCRRPRGPERSLGREEQPEAGEAEPLGLLGAAVASAPGSEFSFSGELFWACVGPRVLL
ncbi:hypothetical protein EYF80_042526 [Liparis tanakae]|uniref:Uncharacterized protein n=1 Tax=Liparis tanakae TaxID=230148 RepID=A0A4Z2G285_9TELE|nr:hypothetical protein EYF80_042526 [Liparis tanakae]